MEGPIPEAQEEFTTREIGPVDLYERQWEGVVWHSLDVPGEWSAPLARQAPVYLAATRVENGQGAASPHSIHPSVQQASPIFLPLAPLQMRVLGPNVSPASIAVFWRCALALVLQHGVCEWEMKKRFSSCFACGPGACLSCLAAGSMDTDTYP